MDEQLIKSRIRDIPDYPKKGIVFRDITTLLSDGAAFQMCIDALADSVKDKRIDYIMGIEARGFIIASALAYKTGKGFIPARKKGKLPWKTVVRSYDLEYGKDSLEMHEDAVGKGSSVLIADDLLATGGTAKAAAEMIGEMGANVAAIAFLVELTGLKGREKLSGYEVISLAKY
ncbi:MAG: adenine phosphoribosyltransferase [Candidatus Micrarchaeota archaeon]|nr:adenine phosphoribosyltransferase [Candidatus Micrarchaeota archaeon]